METEESRNHGDNKSPSSSGKVHVVSAEIIPEPKQSPTVSNVSSHSNNDVDVCVVTKEGVTKQDEIKYIDESPIGSSPGKAPSVTNDNADADSEPKNKTKENEAKQNESGGSPDKDKHKSVSKEANETTSPNGKHKTKENKELNFSRTNASHRTDRQSAPSERDALLNGGAIPRDVVVEDMSNIDEKMPITKL